MITSNQIGTLDMQRLNSPSSIKYKNQRHIVNEKNNFENPIDLPDIEALELFVFDNLIFSDSDKNIQV